MYTQGLGNNISYIILYCKQSPAVGVVVVEQMHSQVEVGRQLVGVEGLHSQEGEPHKQGVFDTKGVAWL